MYRLLSILSVIICTAYMANAQKARVTRLSAPFMGSVVLKDVENKYDPHVYNLEMPTPDAHSEKMMLRAIKRKVSEQFPHTITTSAKKTTAAPSPVVSMGFVADSLSGIPPDNDMAINKNGKAVSVINTSIAVSDATIGKVVYRRNLGQFTAKVALNGTNDYRYDPKIIYDPENDKFICAILNSTNENNWIIIGFSKTSDPTGGWNFYKFYGDYSGDTTWFDYPCIAITKDEFFLTGNKIGFNTSWQSGFKQTVIYQVKKKDGYDSVANLTYQVWDSIDYNGRAIRNLYPVKGGAGILGPEQYFLSNRNFDVQNDTIFLVKVPDVISSGNTNLDIKVLQSPVSYGVPPNGRQPDTSVELATNDGRILGAFADGDDIQFVSTSVHPVSGSSAVFHGRINNYKINPVINHAQFFSIDTLDFGYPNITYAGNPWGLPQALISFNYTGPNTFPGVGAVLFDGSTYSDMVRVKEGVGSIKLLAGKEQRWGDYMGAQHDWNDISGGTIWIEGIYGRADNRYGNWMAKLNSPLLTVKEQVHTSPSSVYPNPAWQYLHFDFEVPASTVVDFAIYGLDGQLVDKLLRQKCKKGRNEIQFDVSSLPAGSYFLKAVDSEGQPITTKTFVKE